MRNAKVVPASNFLTAAVLKQTVDPKTGQIHMNRLRPVLKENGGVQQNALLRKDEWEVIEKAVYTVFKPGILGVTELENANLVNELQDLGVILSGYQVSSDMSEANISMSGATAGEEDAIEFDTRYVPIPIVHKDFSLDLRQLLAGRRGGAGLDTTYVTTASRRVKEALQGLFFQGWSGSWGGNHIYGIANHPQAFTDTATNYGGGDFGTAGNFYKTVNGVLNAMSSYGFEGPYGIYVATAQFAEIRELDANGMSDYDLVLEKFEEVQFIKRVPSTTDMPAGSISIVQMTADVITLQRAEDVQPVQWAEAGGFTEKFRIFAAEAPRLIQDYNDIVGVTIVTGC